jgi:hypothetical protein
MLIGKAQQFRENKPHFFDHGGPRRPIFAS